MTENLDTSKLLSEINSLKEKISKFENENYNIKSAISQIIEKEEENKKKIDISIQELKILKKRQEKFECLISKDLSSFKQEINNDENFNLLKNKESYNLSKNVNNNNIDSDINSDDIENYHENDIKKSHLINNGEIKDKISKNSIKYLKHNYSKDSISSSNINQKGKTKLNKNMIDDNLNKEYKEAFNKNEQKLFSLEKRFNDLSTQYITDLKNVNDMIQTLKNIQKNSNAFEEKNSFILKDYKENFENNAQNNKLFIAEVSNIIQDFQKKINNLEEYNNNILEKNNKLDLIFNIQNTKFNEELKEFYSEMNKQVSDQNKEIENFEKFLSQEHEKFVEFIQIRLDESISSIKKLFDFNENDIKKLNEKIGLMQEIIKKVRTDVFKSINDSEEFLENKYQSLFRLFNKE
jgi:hypothetical protein